MKKKKENYSQGPLKFQKKLYRTQETQHTHTERTLCTEYIKTLWSTAVTIIDFV